MRAISARGNLMKYRNRYLKAVQEVSGSATTCRNAREHLLSSCIGCPDQPVAGTRRSSNSPSLDVEGDVMQICTLLTVPGESGATVTANRPSFRRRSHAAASDSLAASASSPSEEHLKPFRQPRRSKVPSPDDGGRKSA